MIGRLAWSPDGLVLAAPSADNAIWLWNAGQGELLRKLRGQSNIVSNVAWSPDGKKIAAAYQDKTILLWDPGSGKLLKTLGGQEDAVHTVAWSPDGQCIACGSQDTAIQLWNIENEKIVRLLHGHSGEIHSVAWSPDGQTLASASGDKSIRLWDLSSGEVRRVLNGHSRDVMSVAWSPCGDLLASGSIDRTIRLWDANSGQSTFIFEGHISRILNVSFSADGRLLASDADGDSGYLWHIDTGHTGKRGRIPGEPGVLNGVSFHPKQPILAALNEKDAAVYVWDLDLDVLNKELAVESTIYYTNARVVLVGDSGVGKSGLALALTNRPFVATESTHGRHVWPFDTQETQGIGEITKTREALLWDLAGQSGYRLIHQLHLNEVVVALVVFDSHSETNPFAGVRYWDRALRQAHAVQRDTVLPLKKFLVAARADRGGVSVSRERIEAWVRDLGFDGYFETSAKEGWQIPQLTKALQEAIAWEKFPRVGSIELFKFIKNFLLEKKSAGWLLAAEDILYRDFLHSEHVKILNKESAVDLRAQFETCIVLLESQGLVQQFSFGDLVLLQPELLDAYASAIINAAKEEPDGLGCIFEEDVREGCFRIAEEERIKNRKQEKLLLIATIKDLLHHELGLREQTPEGELLIFPSQLTREHPELPEPKGKALVFYFEGAVLNIYATLAIRLSRSGLFSRKEMWKNAISYQAGPGETCGMFMREIEEGKGELALFYDRKTGVKTRLTFEDYIHTHIQRRALHNSIRCRQILVCPECGETITDNQVKHRRERGFTSISCNVCETKIPLPKHEKSFADIKRETRSAITKMDHAANSLRDRDAAKTMFQGKVVSGDHDVFLCYNSEDKAGVKEVADALNARGVLPWQDERELTPGWHWHEIMEELLERTASIAVFLGASAIGPWQHEKTENFLRQFMSKGRIVVLVLLPQCRKEPRLPSFIKGTIRVDFRNSDPEPNELLAWALKNYLPEIR
ncbi:MAG: TIR domain-containing protein [Gammaproteobacteria bacterium]|nr:TIR domain-containing protein [Gammaproteobacteria bacterium]